MSAPDPRDHGWAWLVLLASSLCCIIMSSTYTVGSFNLIFLDVFRQSKALTAWCPSILTSSVALGGPLGGYVAKRFSCRTAVIVGGVISATGMFLASFSPNFISLFLTFGCLSGLGLGIVYTPSTVILGYYFKKYLNIAVGISSATSGIAVMVFPHIIQYLLDSYSWRGAVMIYSGVFLQSCFIGCLMRPVRKGTTLGNSVIDLEKSKYSQRADSRVDNYKPVIKQETNQENGDELHMTEVQPTNNIAREKKTQDKMHIQKTNRRLCANVRFAIFCVSFFCASAGVSSVYMHLQAFAVTSGIDKHKSNMLVSVIGVSSIVGRAASGFIVHFLKLPTLAIYILYMALAGAATVLLPLYGHEYAHLAVFSAIFGMCGTSYNAFTMPITIQLVGVQRLEMAFGVLMLFCGISYLLGPPITGWLYDASSSYSYTFYFSGACFLVSAFMALFCIQLSCFDHITRITKGRMAKSMYLSVPNKDSQL